MSDDERYERLRNVVRVSAGEVRASTRDVPELVIDIAEVIWEELGGWSAPPAMV